MSEDLGSWLYFYATYLFLMLLEQLLNHMFISEIKTYFSVHKQRSVTVLASAAKELSVLQPTIIMNATVHLDLQETHI